MRWILKSSAINSNWPRCPHRGGMLRVRPKEKMRKAKRVKGLALSAGGGLLMRLSIEVRRLLIQALREEDTQRAVELFLAARLLHIIYNTLNGEEEVKKIMEKLNALDAGLRRIYARLKALLLEPAEKSV